MIGITRTVSDRQSRGNVFQASCHVRLPCIHRYITHNRYQPVHARGRRVVSNALPSPQGGSRSGRNVFGAAADATLVYRREYNLGKDTYLNA